jgi:acyl-CoA hydrolase
MSILIQRKTLVISFISAFVFCLGFISGKFYTDAQTQKSYLYININKVMAGVVDHYKEKPLSRKEINNVIESKQKELSKLLASLERQHVVFATPKVVAGAKNITNEVLYTLIPKNEDSK